MGTILARDDRQSVLQVGSYDTENSIDLSDGATTSAYEYNAILRIKALGDVYVKRTSTSGAGMYLTEGESITMLVFATDTLSVSGGAINITPVSK